MLKKTRLSFSSVSKDPNPEPRTPARNIIHNVAGRPTRQFIGGRKKMGGSTFQYTKKRFGDGRGSKRPYDAKSQFNKNINAVKIPDLEEGVIRIVPLGGVEEIGKNMTAVEIGNDIIVIDAGMHFSNEETPGVDYVIPNTTYLEERKEKIRALIVTHAHLDHIGGAPLVLSRIGNPPVYSRNLSILMMRKR